MLDSVRSNSSAPYLRYLQEMLEMLESAKEELDSTGEDQIKLLMEKVDFQKTLKKTKNVIS